MSSIFFIISACTLWALDTLIRYPLLRAGVPASSIVFTEHFLLVIGCLPILWGMRQKWIHIRATDLFSFLFIGGIGSALATIAFTRALSLMNPSLVILLQKFQPIVALILARIVLKEPMKREFLLWASLCLVGGGFISYHDLAPGLENLEWDLSLFNKKFLVGYGLTFIAVFGWGASTVLGKRLTSRNYRESEIMSGRFLFGLFFLLPLMGSEQSPLPSNTAVVGKVFLMVVCSGFLGMYFYYRGLKYLSARLCTLLEMFFPFCAVVVNWVFLDATLTPLQLLGALLLMLGSTVIQIRHY